MHTHVYPWLENIKNDTAKTSTANYSKFRTSASQRKRDLVNEANDYDRRHDDTHGFGLEAALHSHNI